MGKSDKIIESNSGYLQIALDESDRFSKLIWIIVSIWIAFPDLPRHIVHSHFLKAVAVTIVISKYFELQHVTCLAIIYPGGLGNEIPEVLQDTRLPISVLTRQERRSKWCNFGSHALLEGIKAPINTFQSSRQKCHVASKILILMEGGEGRKGKGRGEEGEGGREGNHECYRRFIYQK